jgi:hypothetical protein
VETAIVLTVLEAEPVVGSWRRQCTRNGAEGMPAHITLLYPFTDTSQYVAGRGREIEDVFGRFARFGFTLTSTAYFRARPSVLYLEPDPPDPFTAMTKALFAQFPEHPPYGGAHEMVIPHLTVAEHDDLDALSRIEDEVRGHLPIEAIALEAQLMQHTLEGWRVRRRFSLGTAPS